MCLEEEWVEMEEESPYTMIQRILLGLGLSKKCHAIMENVTLLWKKNP